MYMVFNGLIVLCGLVTFLAWVFIVYHAFRDSLVQGLLTIFLPLYIFFYATVKFTHEKKALVLAAFFGGIVLQLGSFYGMLATAPAPPEPEFDYDPNF